MIRVIRVTLAAVTGGTACSAYASAQVLVCLIAIVTLTTPRFAHAQGTPEAQGGRRAGSEPITSIEERTKSLKKIDGFFPLYWDETAGKLWLEIPKLDTEVLYSTGLATGLGSNDIGLDRGILTGSRIVKFERAGPRVLMVQPNYQFRAVTTNAAEAKTVRDAFARSVLWGFQIAAATGDRLLVDFTEYLVRDGNDIAGRLRPGSYRFDATRSSLYAPMTLNFPKNTEMEAELTFVRNAAGAGGPGGGPAVLAADLVVVAAVAALASARFSKVWAAWPRPPRPRASASTTRSSSCLTATTNRAASTRAPASAAWTTKTMPRCPENR